MDLETGWPTAFSYASETARAWSTSFGRSASSNRLSSLEPPDGVHMPAESGGHLLNLHLEGDPETEALRALNFSFSPGP